MEMLVGMLRAYANQVDIKCTEIFFAAFRMFPDESGQLARTQQKKNN